MFNEGHMVILSAEIAGLNYFHNEARTQEMKLKLSMSKFKFIEAQSVYKGTKEKSFIVKVESVAALEYLVKLADHFRQESILYIDARNQASLYYIESKTREKLGIFHKVPKSVADTLDAYTMTESGYYAC
jgi:hypothetical protein